MSRIGKQPIIIPASLNLTIDGQTVLVKGPKGELSLSVPPELEISQGENTLLIHNNSTNKKIKSLHGLYRSLLANMVEGVSNGFSKHLELVGTGYRVKKEGEKITMSLGFSHPVTVVPPKGITFEVKGDNAIEVFGIDKHLVGQIAANIKAVKKPEPYKGKGIRYRGEHIKLRPGKQVKGAT